MSLIINKIACFTCKDEKYLIEKEREESDNFFGNTVRVEWISIMQDGLLVRTAYSKRVN